MSIISRVGLCAGIMACQVLCCQDGIAHLIAKAPAIVSGKVVDGNGTPIPKAQIDHLAVLRGAFVEEASAKTDSEGQFLFETHSPAVVIRKQGFETLLLNTSASLSNVQLKLKRAPLGEVVVCTAERLKGFGLLRFPRAKGIAVGRMGGSIDATEQILSVKQNGKTWIMIHGTGPSWGGPFPRSREVWMSTDYTETWLRHASQYLIDARGTTRDGKHWRSISLQSESAFYFDLPASAAQAFDPMFEGVCAPK